MGLGRPLTVLAAVQGGFQVASVSVRVPGRFEDPCVQKTLGFLCKETCSAQKRALFSQTRANSLRPPTYPFKGPYSMLILDGTWSILKCSWGLIDHVALVAGPGI